MFTSDFLAARRQEFKDIYIDRITYDYTLASGETGNAEADIQTQEVDGNFIVTQMLFENTFQSAYTITALHFFDTDGVEVGVYNMTVSVNALQTLIIRHRVSYQEVG